MTKGAPITLQTPAVAIPVKRSGHLGMQEQPQHVHFSQSFTKGSSEEQNSVDSNRMYKNESKIHKGRAATSAASVDVNNMIDGMDIAAGGDGSEDADHEPSAVAPPKRKTQKKKVLQVPPSGRPKSSKVPGRGKGPAKKHKGKEMEKAMKPLPEDDLKMEKEDNMALANDDYGADPGGKKVLKQVPSNESDNTSKDFTSLSASASAAAVPVLRIEPTISNAHEGE